MYQSPTFKQSPRNGLTLSDLCCHTVNTLKTSSFVLSLDFFPGQLTPSSTHHLSVTFSSVFFVFFIVSPVHLQKINLSLSFVAQSNILGFFFTFIRPTFCPPPSPTHAYFSRLTLPSVSSRARSSSSSLSEMSMPSERMMTEISLVLTLPSRSLSNRSNVSRISVTYRIYQHKVC